MPPTTQTPFQAAVDARLAALGLSRYEMARRAGIHSNVVYSWFRQGNPIVPNDKTLRKVAPVLHMELDDLMRLAGRLDEQKDATEEREGIIEADIRRRAAGLAEVYQSLDGVPEAFWVPLLQNIFDRTEAEIRDVVELVRRLREHQHDNTIDASFNVKETPAITAPTKRVKRRKTPPTGDINAWKGKRNSHSQFAVIPA